MLGVAQDRMVDFSREHERQKRYRGLSEFQKGSAEVVTQVIRHSDRSLPVISLVRDKYYTLCTWSRACSIFQQPISYKLYRRLHR